MCDQSLAIKRDLPQTHSSTTSFRSNNRDSREADGITVTSMTLTGILHQGFAVGDSRTRSWGLSASDTGTTTERPATPSQHHAFTTDIVKHYCATHTADDNEGDDSGPHVGGC